MSSRAEIQKAYIARKKAEMGEDAYLALVRERQSKYRQRVKDGKETIQLVKNHPEKLLELEKIFTEGRSRLDRELKPTSVKNYVQKINRLAILLTGQGFDGSFDFILNPTHLIKKLDESSLKSKKDYLSPVVRVLRYLKKSPEFIEQFQNEMVKYKSEETHERGENLATNKERENALTLKEIKKKFEEYKPTTDMELIYKLIVAFYFFDELIPRRNLADFKLVSSKKKASEMNPNFNYITVDKDSGSKKIIMNRYKTEATYGKQVFNIWPELKTLLDEYIMSYKKRAGDFLFVDKEGHPFSLSNFDDLVKQSMKAVLGKPINVDLARKILITDYYSEGVHSINDDKEFARRLLHSIGVSKEYVKVDLYGKKKEPKAEAEASPDNNDEESDSDEYFKQPE